MTFRTTLENGDLYKRNFDNAYSRAIKKLGGNSPDSHKSLFTRQNYDSYKHSNLPKYNLSPKINANYNAYQIQNQYKYNKYTTTSRYNSSSSSSYLSAYQKKSEQPLRVDRVQNPIFGLDPKSLIGPKRPNYASPHTSHSSQSAFSPRNSPPINKTSNKNSSEDIIISRHTSPSKIPYKFESSDHNSFQSQNDEINQKDTEDEPSNSIDILSFDNNNDKYINPIQEQYSDNEISNPTDLLQNISVEINPQNDQSFDVKNNEEESENILSESQLSASKLEQNNPSESSQNSDQETNQPEESNMNINPLEISDDTDQEFEQLIRDSGIDTSSSGPSDDEFNSILNEDDDIQKLINTNENSYGNANNPQTSINPKQEDKSSSILTQNEEEVYDSGSSDDKIHAINDKILNYQLSQDQLNEDRDFLSNIEENLNKIEEEDKNEKDNRISNIMSELKEKIISSTQNSPAKDELKEEEDAPSIQENQPVQSPQKSEPEKVLADENKIDETQELSMYQLIRHLYDDGFLPNDYVDIEIETSIKIGSILVSQLLKQILNI